MTAPESSSQAPAPEFLRWSPLAKTTALSALTVAAVLVHGYHPMVEDGEIYVPAIRRLLNPGLYPHDAQFFVDQTRLSLFPQIIAFSVRVSHVPFDWALLLWHVLSIVLLLAACWKIAELCLPDRGSQWFAVALIASLLTLPVAGTDLYIMDQYLSARSLSTAGAMWAVASILERKWKISLLWIGLTFIVHPLMAALVGAYLVIWVVLSRRTLSPIGVPLACFVVLTLPVSEAYRQAVATRSYLFLRQWEWYEWLGAVAPLLILWCFLRVARAHGLTTLEAAVRTLVIFGFLFFCAGVLIGFTPGLMSLAKFQPMRSLHLIYILMFLLGGGLLQRYLMQGRNWLGFPLLLAVSAVMFSVQRKEFPATAHIEWPSPISTNDWVQGFLWIRSHTPPDAYFALNPHFMTLPAEDEHGFRAIAERSRLADSVKDPGAVTIAPSLAQPWHDQVQALQGWKDFQLADFLRLRQRFGVQWVVLEKPGNLALDCPYENSALRVCRIPAD